MGITYKHSAILGNVSKGVEDMTDTAVVERRRGFSSVDSIVRIVDSVDTIGRSYIDRRLPDLISSRLGMMRNRRREGILEFREQSRHSDENMPWKTLKIAWITQCLWSVSFCCAVNSERWVFVARESCIPFRLDDTALSINNTERTRKAATIKGTKSTQWFD